MKKVNILIMMAAVAGCVVTGCSKKTYYQVYQTQPVNSEAVQPKDGNMVHDGSDCTVSYNFFAEEGNAGYWFTNNTDSVIFISLSESFFILNGTAYDHYQARRWTTTSSSAPMGTPPAATIFPTSVRITSSRTMSPQCGSTDSAPK